MNLYEHVACKHHPSKLRFSKYITSSKHGAGDLKGRMEGIGVVRIGEYDICSWSNDYYTNLNLWVLRIKLQVCSYNRRLKHLVLQQYSREVIWSLNPRKDFTWFCGTSNSFRMGLIKVKYDDLCSTKAGHSRKKWDKDSSTFISQHLQILLALGFL